MKGVHGICIETELEFGVFMWHGGMKSKELIGKPLNLGKNQTLLDSTHL